MSSCGKNENPQEMNRRKFLKVFGGGACLFYTSNILAERQLELAWEGWRRQDLVRFGKFTRPYTDRPQLPHESNGYTTVFPIPDKVRSLNPNLTQNPGY